MADNLLGLIQTASNWKLQFSGTVDVSQEEQRAILDSGLVIMVVAARTGKAELDFKESGEVGLKLTLRVSDSAMTTGQLRDGAIAYLAHGPDQGHLVFPNYGYAGQDQPDEPVVAGFDLPDEPESDDGDGGDPGSSEVLGHIGDYREGAAPEPGKGEGPKVAKFDPDMVPGSPTGGTETVGSVYPEGHRRSDKVLANFLDEEHPHSG